MSNKRNVIQLSFKNEGNDLELYTFLKNKLNAPFYIKEILWNYYKNDPLLSDALMLPIMPLANGVVSKTERIQMEAAEVIHDKQVDLFNEDVKREDVDMDF